MAVDVLPSSSSSSQYPKYAVVRLKESTDLPDLLGMLLSRGLYEVSFVDHCITGTEAAAFVKTIATDVMQMVRATGDEAASSDFSTVPVSSYKSPASSGLKDTASGDSADLSADRSQRSADHSRVSADQSESISSVLQQFVDVKPPLFLGTTKQLTDQLTDQLREQLIGSQLIGGELFVGSSSMDQEEEEEEDTPSVSRGQKRPAGWTPTAKTSSKPGKTSCRMCSQAVLRSKNMLIGHIARHSNTPLRFKCIACPAAQNRLGNIRLHVKQNHPELDVEKGVVDTRTDAARKEDEILMKHCFPDFNYLGDS